MANMEGGKRSLTYRHQAAADDEGFLLVLYLKRMVSVSFKSLNW
jgi:hypothetical protein